jgi:hypothetical protein
MIAPVLLTGGPGGSGVVKIGNDPCGVSRQPAAEGGSTAGLIRKTGGDVPGSTAGSISVVYLHIALRESRDTRCSGKRKAYNQLIGVRYTPR